VKQSSLEVQQPENWWNLSKWNQRTLDKNSFCPI